MGRLQDGLFWLCIASVWLGRIACWTFHEQARDALHREICVPAASAAPESRDNGRFGMDWPTGAWLLCSWAAYVAGALVVLMRERGMRFADGLSILISSAVPEGKGVSSSAAVEVATMQALTAAQGLALDGRDLALLCQKVTGLAWTGMRIDGQKHLEGCSAAACLHPTADPELRSTAVPTSMLHDPKCAEGGESGGGSAVRGHGPADIGAGPGWRPAGAEVSACRDARPGRCAARCPPVGHRLRHPAQVALLCKPLV